MDSETKVAASVDEYIGAFPPEIQEVLQAVRAVVREAAPEAQETIKYAMPTYMLHGNLVYFAAYKHHIGFYPTPSGTERFQEQIARYKSGKGSIRFPLSEPMPIDLIRDIVRFRVAENEAKAVAKHKKK